VPSYPLLHGKRAVVFGAGGSIGSAVAKAFAAEGAEVFLAGRSEESLKGVAKEIAEAGAGPAPTSSTPWMSRRSRRTSSRWRKKREASTLNSTPPDPA